MIKILKELKSENDIFSLLTGVYIFTWYTQLGKRISLFGDIRFEFLLGSFLVIASLLRIQSQRKKIENPLRIPAITLVIYYGIFAFLSYNPEYSWNIYFNRVIKFSMLALFIATFIDNIPKLKYVLTCYFLAALKAGQEGLVGWLSGNMVWENQGIPRLHGSIDMYGHPNSFSGFAVGLLPFIYFFYGLLPRILKPACAFLFLCAIVIILFTGSRTGYIATLALFTYAAFTKLKGSFFKYAAIFLLCLPIIISFIPPEYIGRFQSIYTMKEEEGGSSAARLQIIYDALEIFFSHPFGVGISAFTSIRQDTFGRSQDTHNLYLEVLTNTGFIGLIIFLWFVKRILATNSLIIKSLKDKDSDDAKLLTSLSRALIGFVWARLFLGLFGMDMYEIYWWFALGFTMASYKLVKKFE